MIAIVIPAKGRSNRLANKNMTPIHDRPMIDYTIDAARASTRADVICVSTDNATIADYAEKSGVRAIRRAESLGGETPLLEVYRHALHSLPEGPEITVMVGLQPDHPDRDIAVDETIAIFERDGLDRLMSDDAQGTHNGAHYVLSRHFVETGESRADGVVVDDCTNIHHAEDLARAARRLATRA